MLAGWQSITGCPSIYACEEGFGWIFIGRRDWDWSFPQAPAALPVVHRQIAGQMNFQPAIPRRIDEFPWAEGRKLDRSLYLDETSSFTVLGLPCDSGSLLAAIYTAQLPR